MNTVAPGRQREMIRAVLAADGARDVTSARRIIFDVVTCYWQSMAPNAAHPSTPDMFGADVGGRSSVSPLLISSIAGDLGRTSPLDASFIVGRMYMALLPKAFRSRLGIYFTPPPLARRLVTLAHAAGVDLASARVLDPACGGGAFLAPIVNAKLATLGTGPSSRILDELHATVRGYDVDPFGAWLSQVFVEAVALPVIENGQRAPAFVQVRDAMDAPDSEDFDLVIANPPYTRAKLSDDQRRRFERSLYGHANLYGVFTDLALRFAKPGGIVAFVTPTSFLAGRYFMNLRRLLAHQAPPQTLEFVSDRNGVFDDVLQETLLAVYRKNGQSSPAHVGLLRTLHDGTLRVERIGRFFMPSEPTEPWIVPREARQNRLIKAAREHPTRLSTLGYRVSTGPLVWNRRKHQLRTEPGPGRYPLIWAEAVMADGRFKFRAERRNHAPYFEPVAAKDDWLVTRSSCVLVQRTTAKEQSRRLIAAELPVSFLAQHGAAVVENHLNMIHSVRSPAVPPHVIAALLQSRIVDELFRCMSGSVAVSAFELEALPLPGFATLKTLDALTSQGADQMEIEALLEDAYLDGVSAAA